MTGIPYDGELASEIRKLGPFKRVVETGTFDGRGSTRILAEISERVVTIDVVRHADLLVLPNVDYLTGLSIPRRLLPSLSETQRQIEIAKATGRPVDYDHAEEYHAECPESGPDDVLGRVLTDQDLVLLDSAGHLGFMEFLYCVNRIRGPVTFVLDDAKHLKHWRTVEYVRWDQRFKILARGDERFGWAIVRKVL